MAALRHPNVVRPPGPVINVKDWWRCSPSPCVVIDSEAGA